MHSTCILKEIVERRHGEPIKFLFLPMFSWAKFLFLIFFLHCRVCTKKLLDTKVYIFFKFGYRVKGLSPLLLPLVSLCILQYDWSKVNFPLVFQILASSWIQWFSLITPIPRIACILVPWKNRVTQKSS